MKNLIIQIVINILATIGLGVLLHYYAFAIAWGVKKGLSKIVSENNYKITLPSDISIKLKSPE